MNIQETTQFFKALADPVRLRILNLLFHQDDICVCDIVTSLSLPQSVVSRHLAYLRKHGLVQAERRGNWQYYSHAFSSLTLASDNGASGMQDQLKALLANHESCNADLEALSSGDACASEKACC